MKKTSLIIWVLSFILGITALYVVYNKNKPDGGRQSSDNSTGSKPREIDESKILKQMTLKVDAPDFELKDLKGKNIKLSDYRGKTVFLNFWATWCPYCIEEMPDLDKARKIFAKDNKAELLTINIQESKSLVNEYIKGKKLTLPVLLDTDGSVAQGYMSPFNISGIPVTFIINPDGTIYNIIGGATNKDTILDLAEYISRSRQPENTPR